MRPWWKRLENRGVQRIWSGKVVSLWQKINVCNRIISLNQIYYAFPTLDFVVVCWSSLRLIGFGISTVISGKDFKINSDSYQYYRDETNPTTKNNVEPGATNIILQSKDGGQTWEDISYGLPGHEQPEDFFAGESDLYLRVKNVCIAVRAILKLLVGKKRMFLVHEAHRLLSIVRSYGLQLWRSSLSKMSTTGNWLPIYTNFKRHLMRSVFETSDGMVFIGSDLGLYKLPIGDKAGSKYKMKAGSMDIVE